MQDIQKLIDSINGRTTNVQNYEKMEIAEISEKLREIMKFEQDTLKKIEEFEKTQENQDLLNYAKIISRNVAEQEIAQIQKIYLKKIGKQYVSRSK